MELTAEKLEFLERSTPGNVAIYRLNGDTFETLYVSPGLPALNGMTWEEYTAFSRENASRVMYSEDVPSLLRAVKDCLRTGDPIDCYYRVYHKTLGLDWAHLNARVCGELNGCPVFLAIYTNASVETDLYQNILDHTERRVFVYDRKSHEILFANRAARQHSQAAGTPYSGEKCYRYLHNRKRPCENCIMERSARGGPARVLRFNAEEDIWEELTWNFMDWCGHDAFVLYSDNVTELTQKQLELRNILEATQLQSRAIQLLNEDSDIGDRLDAVLKMMGEYFGADRSYVIEVDSGGKTLSNTFEWCRDGVAPQIGQLQKVDIRYMDRWLPYFRQGEPVAIPDVEKLRDANPGEYEIMSRQNIRSYLEAPLLTGGTLVGFVGVDNPAADRLTNTGDLLLSFAYSISNAILREYSQRQLQSHTLELESFINNIPGGMAVFYERDGVIHLVRANDSYFRLHYSSLRSGAFSPSIKVLDHVFAADRHLVLDEYRRVAQAPGEQGNVTYRIHGKSREIHWINAQFRPAYVRDGLQYYYATCTNLDRQKETELQLKESQRAVKDAVDNTDVQYFTYFPEKHRLEIHLLNPHYGRLPTVWDNYPDSFIDYVKMTHGDAHIFREALRRVDAGEDEVSCLTRMNYEGNWLWIQVKFTAIRDEDGRLVKAEGYASNVSAQKQAEERLQQERVRLKVLEGSTFEAFSFNVTKNAQATLQTTDTELMTLPVSGEVLREVTRIAPPIGDSSAEPWQILLHVANRIPDRKDRELYLRSCGGASLHKAVNEGTFQSSIRYRRRIGSAVHWVESSAEVLPDPASGDLIAFFHSDDINDKVIREKIAERITDTNYEGVAYCDLQTGLLSMNAVAGPAADRYQGLTYDAALELACASAALPAQAGEYREKFRLEAILAALRETSVYTIYYTRRARSKTLAGHPHIRVKSDAFYLDGHRDVLVLLFSDVTEIFEQERESRETLAAALRAAKAANAAKSDFLSRMSHDIRTPLNGIIGMSYLAREQDNPPKTQDCLSKIDSSSKFLLGLVNDVLDMSKAESGKIELHPEPYLARDFFSYLDAVIRPLCDEKNQELRIDASPDRDMVPLMDILRINQIYFNIFSNAVKYTPENGVISFLLRTAPAGAGRLAVHSEIRDTGIGMSGEFQKILFQPFTQERRNDAANNRGTGLGLSIVKQLVDLIGGTIRVESEIGRGSTFFLDMEFDCVPAGLVSPEKAETQKDGDMAVLAGRRVLLCEDHPLNQEIARTLLQEKGMSVTLAEDGKLGVDRFRSSPVGFYDAVLMDIRMPVMDGYEAARAIRALPRSDAETVPILAMTADAFADDVRKCLDAGMDGHIAKPIDVEQFYAALAACVSGGRPALSGRKSGFKNTSECGACGPAGPEREIPDEGKDQS